MPTIHGCWCIQFRQTLVHAGVDAHNSVKLWYMPVLMHTIQSKPGGTQVGIRTQFSQSLVHKAVYAHNSVKVWYTRRFTHTIQSKSGTQGGLLTQFSQSMIHKWVYTHNSVKARYYLRVLMHMIQSKPGVTV